MQGKTRIGTNRRCGHVVKRKSLGSGARVSSDDELHHGDGDSGLSGGPVVKIENNGTRTVQLRTRVWSITDASGHTQEVRGPGVVGEQPVLRPGESFEYTSGTSLKTPSGMMVGSYGMESEEGTRFDVPVPAFSLDSPHQSVRLN
jgi:ApaG protein